MSGHNPPHGRLGQPNSTWNPLQVPSYIPRQPQLAHMSSERSMARSPLTWHTPPNHQDQLYNFMSANHKNNLEINPILPTFGRNAGMPLGSVDLSLSSASRSTPSPKGNHLQPGSSMQQQQQHPPSNIPPGLGGPPPLADQQNDHFHHKMVPGHGQQQQQHHHHMNVNRSPTTVANQIGSVIQSTAALKDRSGQHNLLGSNPGGGGPASCSFLGLGPSLGTGGNGYYNMMSSNSGGGGGGSGSNNSGSCAASAGGSNNSINRPSPAGSVGGPPPLGMANEFGPIIPGGLHVKDAKQLNNEVGKNGRDNISTSAETSDLVKDILLHAMQSNPLSASPKTNSPLRSSAAPQSHSPTRSRVSPLLPPMDSHQQSVNKPFPMISANVPSTTTTTTTPPEVETPIAATASAPNKLQEPSGSPPSCAVPAVPSLIPGTSGNSAGDRISPSQSITSNEDSADSNSSKARRRRKPDRTNKMTPDELERMHDFLQVGGVGGDNSADKCDRIDGIDPMRPNIAVRNDIAATLALEGISSLSQGLASDSSHSPHITDLSDSTRINLQSLNESNIPTPPNNNERTKSPAVVVNSVISNVLSAAAAAVMESTRKDNDSTSDDCETIDKIAAMISSTENETTSLGVDHPLPPPGDSVRRPAACNGPAKQAVEGSLGSGNEKPGSHSKHETDKNYEEIENKLEDMFAGIEETMPACSKSSPAAKKSPAAVKQFSDSADIVNVLSERTEEPPVIAAAAGTDNNPQLGQPGTSGTQKKAPIPPAKRANSGKPAAGTPPNKRKKVLKKKTAGKGASYAAAEERAGNFGKKALAKGKKKGNNGGAGASGSGGAGKNAKVKPNEAGSASATDLNGKYRGPFVQVKTDGSHMVINAPINEDGDSDKPQNKTKKFASSMNNSEKSKIRGLHVSTLSTKYDADTTDTSWMCVFCKMGPHKLRLGDLFGPYIISTRSTEFEQSQTDEDYFSEKRTRESLASKLLAAAKVDPTAPKTKKRKSSVLDQPAVPSTSGTQQPSKPSGPTPEDMFYGMVKAGEDSFEVWMHEDCLIWAPGVYIIGTRIVGLEAAIWNCCRHQCQLCAKYGATVSCLHRGCSAEAHVVCARKNHWTLSDEFKSLCDRHPADDGDSS